MKSKKETAAEVTDSISCALVAKFLKDAGHDKTAQDLVDFRGENLPDLFGLTLQNVKTLYESEQKEEEIQVPVYADEKEKVCFDNFVSEGFASDGRVLD